MSNDLRRRLARLEGSSHGLIHIVDQYVGMSKEDAFRMRYGDEAPPANAVIVHMTNVPETPEGVPYDWAAHRDDPLYPQYWEACRQALRPPFRAGA